RRAEPTRRDDGRERRPVRGDLPDAAPDGVGDPEVAVRREAEVAEDVTAVGRREPLRHLAAVEVDEEDAGEAFVGGDVTLDLGRGAGADPEPAARGVDLQAEETPVLRLGRNELADRAVLVELEDLALVDRRDVERVRRLVPADGLGDEV